MKCSRTLFNTIKSYILFCKKKIEYQKFHRPAVVHKKKKIF